MVVPIAVIGKCWRDIMIWLQLTRNLSWSGTITLMKENQRRYRGYPNIRFGGKVLVVINGKTRCFAERWKGHAASTAKRNLYRFCHGCL